MATNDERSNNKQRVAVECACGKKLGASAQHAGKRLKCPSCGEPVVVPAIAPAESQVAVPASPDRTTKEKKSPLTVLWACVGGFAVVCIVFLVWHSNSSRNAKIAAANDRISGAIANANDWLAGKPPLDADTVEQELAEALGDEIATEKDEGTSTLKNVRNRRQELAQRARIELAEKQADEVFNSARRKIDGKRLQEGRKLLRQYLANSQATKKADAKRLLNELETALSDQTTFDILVAMDEPAFKKAASSGVINDGKVKHPALLVVRNDTVKSNLEKATRRREEIAVAEQKRRAEAERARIADAKLQADGRLTVKLYDVPGSTDKANVVYVSKVSKFRKTRARTHNGVYGHMLVIQFDGKDPEGGSFFNVDGTPTNATVAVDNSKVVTADGRFLKFVNPGKAVVTVHLGKRRKSLRFHVVEIPIPARPSRDDVVKSLGFPDDKIKGDVSWPKYKALDGILYTPKIDNQIILYEHWRYKKYPGLVLAWADGFMVLTRKPASMKTTFKNP